MIEYSIRFGLTKNELNATNDLAEKFFKTDKDPRQISSYEITWDFINKFPLSVNSIKNDGKIIGHTFALPCNEKYMKLFLNDKIMEINLFRQIRDKIDPEQYNSLYLSSAQILPQYQKQGIATRGFEMQIKEYQKTIKNDTELFCWPINDIGVRLARKVERTVNLPLYIKTV